MLFASMAGYALARIPARGRNIVFFLLLLALMIPRAVTFVPLYGVVAFLGGINTLWSILVPGLFNVFATFLFRQFCLDFPVEIEDVGRVDGLGYFSIYRYLLIPNSIGILMALGVLPVQPRCSCWYARIIAGSVHMCDDTSAGVTGRDAAVKLGASAAREHVVLHPATDHRHASPIRRQGIHSPTPIEN